MTSHLTPICFKSNRLRGEAEARITGCDMEILRSSDGYAGSSVKQQP
jgi:hypothetical protein